MDKAPDAFRTISEVADDLDIPQHVLRFWETRFAQIKPMKRSGGRRYYRPDDVDLLRGIRRLLYGEGYTIRGVQRILKEHGVKAVQGLVDGSAAVPSFGAAGDEAMRGQAEAAMRKSSSMPAMRRTRPTRLRRAVGAGPVAAPRQRCRRRQRCERRCAETRPRPARSRAAGPARLPAIARRRDEGGLITSCPGRVAFRGSRTGTSFASPVTGTRIAGHCAARARRDGREPGTSASSSHAPCARPCEKLMERGRHGIGA